MLLSWAINFTLPIALFLLASKNLCRGSLDSLAVTSLNVLAGASNFSSKSLDCSCSLMMLSLITCLCLAVSLIAPPSPANWCIVFNSSNLVSLPISLLIAAITKACITSLRVLFWLFTKALAASGDVADIIFNSFCVKPSFCISIGLPVL